VYPWFSSVEVDRKCRNYDTDETLRKFSWFGGFFRGLLVQPVHSGGRIEIPIPRVCHAPTDKECAKFEGLVFAVSAEYLIPLSEPIAVLWYQ
jgi:hypothetical protein